MSWIGFDSLGDGALGKLAATGRSDVLDDAAGGTGWAVAVGAGWVPVVALGWDTPSPTCMLWMFLVVRWLEWLGQLRHAEQCLLLDRWGHWALWGFAETVGKATKFFVDAQKQAGAACLLVAGGG